MTYAYARISSRDQNLDRQLSAFRSFGIPPKHIFCDKKSGKGSERKNYLRLIRKLKCGDLLVIKSIDWLGRSYDMIIEEWSRITDKIRADILVLDMPLLDTRKTLFPRRQIHIGHRIAGTVFRGGKRTGKHPRSAGGRHCRGKTKRRSFRTSALPLFADLSRHSRKLLQENHLFGRRSSPLGYDPFRFLLPLLQTLQFGHIHRHPMCSRKRY